MRTVIKNSCKWASRVVCVSENTKRDVMRLYGTSQEKIRVIYEGYSGKTAGHSEAGILGHVEKEKCDIGAPYFLFIGRIEERKNVKGIVEAFDIVKEKYGVAHKLVLAGKPGYGYGEIKERIGISKFKNDIVEMGYVSDEEKWTLLGEARCLLFPIDWPKPFGLAMIEAMACGTPVLAYDRGAVPEVVAHGETGFTVHTYEELRDSLKRLAGLNPQRCRDRVAQNFSRDTMVAAYMKLYEEMGRGA